MKIFLISLIFVTSACQSIKKESSQASPLVQEGHALNNYRESLSSGIKQFKKIDFDVFKVTCMPVGARIKKLQDQKDITVKQISHKNRNPNNHVPKDFMSYYQAFLDSPDLQETTFEFNKQDYAMVRIPVQESCLACHGEQKSRPQFIKEKYPNDLAHSFQVGDLRGVYLIHQNK
jgi:hypothetical protein